MSKCNYCSNKGVTCDTCKNENCFVPIDEVKEYFYYNPYNNPIYSKYSYNSTSDKLVRTHHMRINHQYYCPYCGDVMYPIQDRISLVVYGYCCMCIGARAEIEYEKKMKELRKKHEKEIHDLQSEYVDRLSFCTDKLAEIKTENDKKRIEDSECTHFRTLNGEKYTDINQLL